MLRQPSHNKDALNRHPRGGLVLASAIGAILAIWIGLLPRLGELPAVRRWIDANEARGISPAAMYYTELEGIELVAQGSSLRGAAPSPR
jgi:hypothetical protein